METPAEGSTIAQRYRLLRILGSGGMGAVWLAHDLSLDTQCAVKLVDTAQIPTDEARIRFAREAKTAAQLRGANVVDVFDHGEWNGVPFIAMEFLEGEDLAARLERVQRLSIGETYEIIAQVSRALVRAHGHGFVHRDLKPENIFLVPGDEREIAKVLDFGIAKHDAFSLKDKTTKTGSFVGTPGYMSPEQARGKPIDWRSDLWSLAVIIFQCLTGRAPFESEALGELLGLIMYEPIPKLTEQGVELPESLAGFWERAMSRDRELRFQSARELVDAFADAAGIEQRLFVPSITPAKSSDHPQTAGTPLWISEPTLELAPVSDDEASLEGLESALEPDSEPSELSAHVPRDTGSPLSRTCGSSLPPAAPKRKSRQWLVALGAGVLVLVCFAGSVSLLQEGPESLAAATPAVNTAEQVLLPAWSVPPRSEAISVLPLGAPSAERAAPAKEPKRTAAAAQTRSNVSKQQRSRSPARQTVKQPSEKRTAAPSAPAAIALPPPNAPIVPQRPPETVPDYGI